MNEMVERVAEAICATQAAPHTPEQVARAAIAAMREPTDVMADAIWEETADPCWRENAVKAWQCGIDAALAE